MKNVIGKWVLGATAVLFVGSYGIAYAKHDDKMSEKNSSQKMWICETNASSSSDEKDMKATEEMKKGKKSAKAAFDFAMKHCRDCTKITCSMENQ